MQHVDPDNNSSDYEAIFQDDFTDIDSSSDIEEIMNSDSDEESKLLYLTKMGFSEVEVSITMERCGSDSSIAELTDFICADQMAKVTDALLMKQRKLEKKLLNEDDHAVHLSIPMIGSGVPTESDQITQRTLSEDAIGSPYFYYEQIHLLNPMIGFGVHTKPDQITQRTLPEDAIESSYFYYEHMALAPVNVWTGISQYLFDVEPEFVDSKHFHATTLKRAIFIILPIENRFSLILLPPCADAFPLTKK
ncbi:DNA (Cytosine-5)-methyltransferase DRM1/2 isoform 2 [Hibiscus syriacus]|uniref:DNA (Cytosine-5)-methyltransferase DRM1/2 isoform 2 n=1 Tax=Hibiscus syriacus TaxID=106335 RepID=A0A6A3ADP4_HIBSY|nr:DNA (Cytosine-5)-methyltransferase DRM1/2 isoform 2 [Hibiscus syriacus]